MISNEIKNEVIEGLTNLLSDKLIAIVLYGSVARGENGEQSDIDIALIVSSNLEDYEKNKFLQWNAELDLKYDQIFSIVDIEKELLDKWGDAVPFYKNIKDEGIILWKAA